MPEENVSAESVADSNTVSVDKSFLSGLSEGISSIKNFILRKDVSKDTTSTTNVSQDIDSSVENYLRQKESQQAVEKARKDSDLAKEELLAKKAAETVQKAMNEQARDIEEKQILSTFANKVMEEEKKSSGFSDSVKQLSSLGEDTICLLPYLNEMSNFKEVISHLSNPDNLIEVRSIINDLKAGNSKAASVYFNNLDKKTNSAKTQSNSDSLINPVGSRRADTSTGKIDGFELGLRSCLKRNYVNNIK